MATYEVDRSQYEERLMKELGIIGQMVPRLLPHRMGFHRLRTTAGYSRWPWPWFRSRLPCSLQPRHHGYRSVTLRASL